MKGDCGCCWVGACGFVDATNWGLVKFKQDENSTVEPRYCEHLSPSVEPDMNGASQMTSMDFAFMPTTTPLNESGTLPESWTMITRSPSAKCWLCRRYTAWDGLRTAWRGMPLTIAFLMFVADLLAVKLSASASISLTVVCAQRTLGYKSPHD